MRSRILLHLLATLCALSAPAQTHDPKAVEVAQAMMDAMGGQEAWNNARYIRYDFHVSNAEGTRVNRAHLWDKWEGRYRYEFQNAEGAHTVVLFNVNSKEGTAVRDGEALAGEALTEAIDGAYKAYINDMYWLAMPWKWLDDGVSLKYLGEEEHAGKPCDVVELSFQSVGLTPGDTYRGYVDKESRMMIHWAYTLQSGNEGAWDWEYAKTGGIMLGKDHDNGSGMSIAMGEPQASAEIDETYFTDPGMSLR